MPGLAARHLPFITIVSFWSAGIELTDLGPSDPTLLAVIISATSTLWAIGFAAYAFIFKYLHDWAVPKEIAGQLDRPHPVDAKSLRDNKRVFAGFIVQGAVSLLTILTAGAAFYTHDPAWVPLAGVLFTLTLLVFFVLFVNEVRTSIQFVTRLQH